MIKYICDRCGEEIKLEHPCGVTLRACEDGTLSEPYDLCHHCFIELVAWLQEGKDGKNNN